MRGPLALFVGYLLVIILGVAYAIAIGLLGW
jgi:hypothetical protein